VNLPGPDIFISYNREDAAVAKLFADAFAREGMEVWWDQTLRSGESYDEVTEAALRGAKAVVVLWSPRSVASHWVRAEATFAHRSKTLVPATIEPRDKPVMFELTQTAELSHWRGEAEDAAWLDFLGDVRRMTGREVPRPEPISTPPTTVGRLGPPFVALLPIAYRGGEQNIELLAEDMTEEVTRALSQNGFFKMIAAGTMAAWRGQAADYRALHVELGVTYAIEGKLQLLRDSVRLTAQLVENATSGMLKTVRLAREIEDIEREIEIFAADIATEIGDAIEQIELDRALAINGKLSGWEHALRTMALSRIAGPGAARKQIEEARLAVAAAPDLGLGHALLASALAIPVSGYGEVFDEGTRQEVLAHADRALTLDGNNQLVISNLISAYAALGDQETCVRIAERAVELNPNSTHAIGWLAIAYGGVGRFADSIATTAEYERRSRTGYFRSTVLWACALSLFFEGRLPAAEEALDRAMAIHPNFVQSLKWKAIIAASLGKAGEAKTALRRMREVESGIGLEQHVRQMLRVPAHAERSAEAVATLRRLWDETGGAG
jgi:TolB-like protein